MHVGLLRTDPDLLFFSNEKKLKRKRGRFHIFKYFYVKSRFRYIHRPIYSPTILYDSTLIVWGGKKVIVQDYARKQINRDTIFDRFFT